jgi:hypothetical protein
MRSPSTVAIAHFNFNAIAINSSDRISNLSPEKLSALAILASAQGNATAILNFNSIDDLEQ